MSRKGEMLFDVLLNEFRDSSYDTKPTTDESYAAQLRDIHHELANRNKKLTHLFADFIESRSERVEDNRKYKKILFWLFSVILAVLTLCTAIVFIKTDFNNVEIEAIASLLSVGATYVVSVISIFKIISEYLFPADEDKDTIDMITKVISNDIDTEEMMLEVINDTKNEYIAKLKDFKALLDDNVISEEEYESLKSEMLNKMKCDG